MKNQEITLRNEAGDAISKSFSNMLEAAEWCAEYPDYGVTLELGNDGDCWDSQEWQDVLDSVFN